MDAIEHQTKDELLVMGYRGDPDAVAGVLDAADDLSYGIGVTSPTARVWLLRALQRERLAPPVGEEDDNDG